MTERMVRIADFAKITAGGTPSRAVGAYFGGPIPWVKTLDLNIGLVVRTEETITNEGLDSIRGNINPPGSVMVAMYGGAGTIGKSGVLGISAATNQAVASILPNAAAYDSDFLHFQLVHLRGEWMQFSQGNRKDPNINKSVVEDMLVWLPGLPNQKQIAARLKTQLAAVEQARQAAQAQMSEIDVLAHRIQENVSDELNAVPRVALGDVLLVIETGKSFQTTERLAKDDELGVLKVSAVSWSKFEPREAKAVAVHYIPEPHHRVRAGDLLMSRANTVELVGAVVGVSNNFPNRLLSDKTLRLVLDESKTCPDYVMQVLRMAEARAHIEGNATGTSNSMRNISQGTIRATRIPLPPLRQQRAIAQRLRESDLALREARVVAQAQLADIEALPARLLARAFDPDHFADVSKMADERNGNHSENVPDMVGSA